MDSRQIELILALANEAIQRALQADRGNIALKRLAAALGAAALELKQTASNVITVRIENTTPLHLICLRYNLPYSAAERLLKLNPGIKDPNRVKGEVLIYV
jgi:prophage DNA circulation protein